MTLENESPVAVARRPVVVCVDDEAPVLASLRRTLRKEPYDVLTTQDPGEALQWIERTAVDLVITDQRMPGMSGLQLLHAVAERHPGPACLMLTAYPDTPAVVESARSGVMRLMTKPWTEEDLRETVRHLVTAPPSDGETRSASPWIWSCPDVQELQVALDCRGRSASELLGLLDVARERPECDWAGWVIVLEHFHELEDSAAGFFRRLTERVRAWGIPTNLVDRSGESSTFLERDLASVPIAVYAPGLFDLRRREVLLVEGNARTRAYLGRLFRGMGHSCASACSIEAALAATRPRPDLVFLDLSLPETESFSSDRQVPDLYPDIEIVALSAFREVWDDGTGTSPGFSRHLQKPMRALEVLSTLGVIPESSPLA